MILTRPFTMTQYKAFVFKLKPNGEACRKLAHFCGCARFVYNKALSWEQECRQKDPSFKASYQKFSALLPQWKKELPWLAKCHAQVLQQSLMDLMESYVNFFEGRANFPKFHRKFIDEDSIRYPQAFKVDEARRLMYLPKIGWIPYHRSRFLTGIPKSITVSRKADGWYASVLTEQEETASLTHPKAGDEVGLDAGVKQTATLSDGTVYSPLNALKKKLDQLRKLQRQLSHKTPFSNNWRKCKRKIALLHKQIADMRKDHLQKLTTDICKNHAVVYREDLRILNMTASARGTEENPGKNVKQKSGLNRAILDQGWGMLFRMLDYKMEKWGGEVYAVPPQYTSQTCPQCGSVSPLNRLTQADFHCLQCGYRGNADVVAASNILYSGQLLKSAGKLQSTAVVRSNRAPRKRHIGQSQKAKLQGETNQ